MTKKLTQAELDARIAEALERRTTLRNVRGGVFLGRPGEDVRPRVNIGIATRKRYGHADADIFVGVRHDELERRVALACGESDDEITPSVIEPLYSVIADHRTYITWELRFDEHLDEDVESVVDAVLDHGMPWMAQLHSLEAIIEQLNASYRVDLAVFRVPVALAMLGRIDQSEQYLARATTQPTPIVASLGIDQSLRDRLIAAGRS